MDATVLRETTRSALAKLKAAADEGPGGQATLTASESMLTYRLLTEQLKVDRSLWPTDG